MGEIKLVSFNKLKKKLESMWHKTGSADAAGAIDEIENFLDSLDTIDSDSLHPQWVSVEDGLPQRRGQGYFLCATNCYGQRKVFEGFTGYMTNGKFEWRTNRKDINLNVWKVTHWMSLPEPPAEREG